jgi:superfamily II DNA or RNA helicase
VIQGSKKDVSDDVDIVVAMIQTVVNMASVPPMFGFSIVDECHHIAAETFSTIFEKCTTRYAMGISATVQRKDGLTQVLHHHLGQLIVDIQADVNERQATIHVLEYRKAAVGRTPVDKITCIVRDEERNGLILLALKKLVEEDVNNERKILILSERRDHVKRIGEELGEIQSAKSVGIYLGGMKTADLDAEKSKDVVCSTYTMFGEGISVKKLNTLVLLTPKGDVCQVMGRIFRQRHVIRPWIVDIVDAGGEGKLRSRMRTYKAQLSDMAVTRQGLGMEMKWS